MRAHFSLGDTKAEPAWHVIEKGLRAVQVTLCSKRHCFKVHAYLWKMCAVSICKVDIVLWAYCRMDIAFYAYCRMGIVLWTYCKVDIVLWAFAKWILQSKNAHCTTNGSLLCSWIHAVAQFVQWPCFICFHCHAFNRSVSMGRNLAAVCIKMSREGCSILYWGCDKDM